MGFLIILLLLVLFVWAAIEIIFKELLGMRVKIDGKYVELPWRYRVPRCDRDSDSQALRLHPDAVIPEGLKRPPSSLTSATDEAGSLRV